MQSLLSKKAEISWHSSGVRWLAVGTIVAGGFVFALARGSVNQSAAAAQRSDQTLAAVTSDHVVLPPVETAGLAPAPTPAPVESSPIAAASPTAPAVRTDVLTYAVRDGDTLSDLADKYSVSVDTIRWANNLRDDFLQIDQQLLIPPVSGVLYTVRDGDNIRDLASTYQVDQQAILAANKLSNPDALDSGSKLMIPGASPIDPSRLIVAVRGGERQGAEVAVRTGITSYEVKPGDTLNAIASRFDVTVSTIASANSIPDPDHLTLGQILLVPSTLGVLHTVQDGDSVVWIASRYGVSVESIVGANKLSSPGLIKPGDHILIPSPTALSGSAAAAAPEAASGSAASSYTVQPGDTLLAIAYRLGVDADRIAQANGLAEPFFLRDGQVLQIPGGSGQSASTGATASAAKSAKHTVVPGDTVFGLSVMTRVSQDSIISLNGLQPPYMLQIGQVLVIPAGSDDDPPAAPRAAAPTSAPAARPAPAPAAEPAAPAPASSLGQRIADLAVQYRGYRYTWGGVSPSSGFDCSGFVYYIFRQVGLPIPRDLFGQLNAGRRVSRSELQPGDIVFFANTYAAGLSHDGIYIGGGRFINANNENVGVIINSLGEAYWSARYYAASRPGQ